MAQCCATKKDGDRCEIDFGLCSECQMCFHHCQHRRDEAQAARRKGGQTMASRIAAKGLDPDELPPLKTPQDAGRWLEVIGRAVATGRLGHHEASAAVRAVREWIKALDAGEIADQIEAMRDALDEWRETGDPSAVLTLVE